MATDNKYFEKDVEATMDFSTDWNEWLDRSQDAVNSYQVILPLNSSLALLRTSQIGGLITAWFGGGDVGKREPVTFRITTVNGRRDDRTIYIRITKR